MTPLLHRAAIIMDDFRPHRNTILRPIVTDEVAWSVGRSVTIVSPVKIVEPIGWAHVLDGFQIPHIQGQF